MKPDFFPTNFIRYDAGEGRIAAEALPTCHSKGYGQARRQAAVCSFPLSVQSTTKQAPTDSSPEFCNSPHNTTAAHNQVSERAG